MKLFGIKTCGSVSKARNFLEKYNIEYEFVDLKTFTLSLKQVQRWVDLKGIDIVLNSKGSTYKKLGLKDMNLTLEGKIQFCLSNQLLLKRPIIDGFSENEILIGFDEELYKKVLKV